KRDTTLASTAHGIPTFSKTTNHLKGSKKHEQTRFISTNSYDRHVVNYDSFVPISGKEHTNFCICNYHSHFIFHLSDIQDTDEKEVNQKSHLNLTALEVNA
ncbi:hypothetical protein, partial [Lactiplantibacillus plantarum]|uniref:hypothetical protein n=1 Tax=Lactiplantibacillus plantarum TaxID=1590 RepID=UPI003C1E6FAA